LYESLSSNGFIYNTILIFFYCMYYLWIQRVVINVVDRSWKQILIFSSIVFNFLYTLKPSVSLILTSRTRTSYPLGLKLANSRIGSSNASTSNSPLSSNTIFKEEEVSLSSSITRILFSYFYRQLLFLYLFLSWISHGYISCYRRMRKNQLKVGEHYHK
jgi:hypothetical protein